MWSALSTQHSALSTQHSASFNRKWFCLLALLIGLCAFSQSANAACYRLDRDIFFGRTPLPLFSTPFAACHQSVEDWNEIRKNETNHPSWTSSFAFKELRSEGNELDFTCIASETMLRTDDGTVFLVHDTLEMVRRYDQFSVTCPNTPLTLTLTPAPNQKDPRPLKAEGKDGKSTYELIAKVMEGSTPKAGVAVTFKVEVKEGSGEHGVTSNGDHVHANRPKGKITPSTEKTNTSGEIRIKFESSDPAGTHIVTATCETCSNKSATKDVKVLVPDLVELTADKGTPKTFDLVGNTNYPGTNHPGNHYFTAAAKETLVTGVIPTMIEAGWGVVGVNDGSLKDGGLFDIYGNWTTSHAGHRTGTEVDISFKQPKGVGDKTVQKAYKELCKKEGAAFDIQTLWHKNDGYEPHYHIYLNGFGLSSGPKEKCCERYRTPKKDKEGNIVRHTSGKNKGQPVYLYFCEEQTPSQ